MMPQRPRAAPAKRDIRLREYTRERKADRGEDFPSGLFFLARIIRLEKERKNAPIFSSPENHLQRGKMFSRNVLRVRILCLLFFLFFFSFSTSCRSIHLSTTVLKSGILQP